MLNDKCLLSLFTIVNSEIITIFALIMIGDRVEIDGIRFEKIISSERIDGITSDLASRISQDYKGKEVLFLVVLNGAFMFAADLLRKVEGVHEVCFIKLASYQGTESSGKLMETIALTEEVKGRDIVVIEDIVDSGFTMGELLKDLKGRGAASVEICALTFKPRNFKGNYNVRYVGMSIENDFIVGYGLDLNQKGRNLKDIFQKSEK